MRNIRRPLNTPEQVDAYILPAFREQQLFSLLKAPAANKTFELYGRSYHKSPAETEQTDVYVDLTFK